MKKTLVKWLALSLVLCCLIPLIAGCSIFEDKVTRTAKKILTKGNFTLRVEHDDDTTLTIKIADDAYLLSSESHKYICYYDADAEKYKAYSRSGTDSWKREDFSLYYPGLMFMDEDGGLFFLDMFIHFQNLFTETDDGVYTCKETDYFITIKSTKKGLKVTTEWTSSTGVTFTTVYSFSDIGKTVVDIPDAVK